MLSQSSSETRVAPAGTVRPRAVAALSHELARELAALDPSALKPAELRALLHGMTGAASALTRFLDRLRECRPGSDPSTLAPASHHSVLEQAAAAAEDLRVSGEALARLS